MKSWLREGTLAAAIALPALSGVAWAGGTDDFGCSNATLKGEYAFGVTNYTASMVVAGIKIFDGNGNFTQRDYPGDGLQLTPPQTDFSPKGRETGTYAVNSDCTGSMVINLNVPNTPPPHGLIKIMFVISNGGRHIHEVVSQFIPPGSTQPVPTQTSADDWKVASKQEQN
jgi:hypothetical protein